MIRLLRRFPTLKRALLSSLNWYEQTLGQPPYRWWKLPMELIWFSKSILQYRRLIHGSKDKFHIYPILFQRGSISFDAQYAYQAAWASYRLMDLRPARHFDISSDLRFVMQLSSLLPVTYLEYRPPHLHLPNLNVLHASITQLPFADRSISSLSCLHVIEHIGLGRYGDLLDPSAHRNGLKELERILAPGGHFFLSVPIGSPVTLFNAHRIFDPSSVPTLVPELLLEEFSVITTRGDYYERAVPGEYVSEEYACGLYLFRRAESI